MDKTLDKAFIDNKCSFLEIEITMLMVKEKISQQKHELYSMYLESREKDTKDDDDEETKTNVPDHMFK
jgi:glutathionylspermidine synthase